MPPEALTRLGLSDPGSLDNLNFPPETQSDGLRALFPDVRTEQEGRQYGSIAIKLQTKSRTLLTDF